MADFRHVLRTSSQTTSQTNKPRGFSLRSYVGTKLGAGMVRIALPLLSFELLKCCENGVAARVAFESRRMEGPLVCGAARDLRE